MTVRAYYYQFYFYTQCTWFFHYDIIPLSTRNNLLIITKHDPLLIVLLQINLRLILVSGKTKEFLFSPSDSAGEIAKTVFEQWPEGE